MGSSKKLSAKAAWYFAQLSGGAVAQVVVTTKNAAALKQLVAFGFCRIEERAIVSANDVYCAVLA